jgi:hypothetical protein
LWLIFALLDPDPGTPLNLDPIRICNTATKKIKFIKSRIQNIMQPSQRFLCCVFC